MRSPIVEKPKLAASVRSGPNFVGLWDQEQDPEKLFKQHHVESASAIISSKPTN